MDILFVATELAPAVKASPLADVVFALSKTLKNLGHKVTIALPRYPAFERAGVLAARRLTPLNLPGLTQPPGGSQGAKPAAPKDVTVFDGRLASGVELVLFDATLPDGTGLFADVSNDSLSSVYEKDGKPHPLAALRASILCRSAIELMKQRVASEQAFDIAHAHDWAAAMVPYLMRLAPELEVTESVLTIHDVRRQGVFERDRAREVLAMFGLGEDHFTTSRLEFYGGVNLLKAGIVAADAVTTVSPAYAREICSPAGGERLDGVLRARKEPVVGIVDGVDYSVWNPATAPSLVARYDADDPANKGRCKTTLLAELGLELDAARPLFVSLSGLSADKGGDLLAAALPRLLKQELSMLVAGPADEATARALDQAVKRAPERVKFVPELKEADVHRWLAAADFVLMPSRYEPSGAQPARAQRYGALPIAPRVGAFIDTIVDLDAALETGTGFITEPPKAADDVEPMVSGVGRALAAFQHPRFGAVRRRVMRVDASWDRPARRYAQVYKQTVEGK